MKKILSLFLALVMLLALLPAPRAAAEGEAAAEEPASAASTTMAVPGQVERIEAEAFAGDTSFTTVMIPKTVTYIGSKAFAGCTGLQEVYLGNNPTMVIAPDAFDAGADIHFYVYAGTLGELYALARGYECDLLSEGSAFLDRAMSLIAENGGSTVLQSGEFASKRLITLRNNGRLPDITAYNPEEIIRDGDLFILQFSTVDDAAECYTCLANDGGTVFVEPDECVMALDEVSGAAVVDGNIWNDDDPMGFEEYSAFVAENGVGTVTIAVVDSGVARNASYSANGRLREDGINMLKIQDGQEWYNDLNRHGSVVASVINDCVGSANVRILPVRVVGASGTTDYILLGNGIKYAVQKGAKVINLSLNFKQSDYVTMCINEAMAAGVKVVVAAGNDGRNISNVYPANVPGVFAVSGLAPSYQLSANSNYGANIQYCAPDSYIKTSAYANSLFNGTSFAAPMISSALALLELDKANHSEQDMIDSCYLSNDTDSPANSYGKGMPQLDKIAFIKVEAIGFDSAMPAVMNVGESLPVSWTVTPSNATDKRVSALSSDENVIRVVNGEDGSISLSAAGKGTATVTLTSLFNESIQTSRTFTVLQPITGITVTAKDNKTQLSLTKTLKMEAAIEPADASSQAIEWVSTNTQVADISASGTVTPHQVGTTQIYARALDGSQVESARFQLEVVEEADPEGVVLRVDGRTVTDGEIQMVPNSTKQIDASVLPEDASQEVTFRVTGNGKNYIDVSETGLITAKASGDATILVMTADNSTVVTLDVQVVVLPETVTVTGETVIDEGGSTTLSAAVLPETATDRSVSWRSSNPNVATVVNGQVTAVKAGQATIIATANGDSSVSGQITVTVRHPYLVNFNTNTPEEGLLPVLTSSSKMAYSGYAVGELPTGTCDYYEFAGWYTQPSGGMAVNADSALETEESQYTLYAHWTPKATSGWVLTSSVPAGARVVATSYSYTEYTESTASSLSGWWDNGWYWKQTGSGSKEYASFPSTFKTSHSLYTSMNGSGYEAYENDTSKREVSNTHTGYIYWHWAYNVAYANNTHRWISDRKQTAGSSRGLSDYAYKYFYAFKSTTNASKISDFTYTWGANAKYNSSAVTYNCSGCLPSGADKSATSGLATPRFLRFNYYTSTYTDYTKYYKYMKLHINEGSYPTSIPGSTLSEVTTYVMYRPK